MLPLLLVVLFIVVPIAELAVIIQVGQSIGLWPTIALLVLDSVVGSALLRSQGRLAWRRFNAAIGAGRPPAREVLDGALVVFGGALLLTPGFLTDVLGLVLLLPPTRAAVRGVLVRRATMRMLGGLVGGRSGTRRERNGAGPRGRADAPRPVRHPGAPGDLEVRGTDLDPPSGRS